MEPIDPEKKILRERVNTLEVSHFNHKIIFKIKWQFKQAQLKLMTERYKTLHNSIAKLKNDTYKMRQKMKVLEQIGF